MRTIIFDLDNTLYDVEQYYSGAFQQIADYLSEKYDFRRDATFQKLMSAWKKHTSAYPYLFDDVVKELNMDSMEVNNLRIKFNNYSGKLNPYKDTVSVLNFIKKNNLQLGLISDGDPARQIRKLDLLKINDFFKIKVFPKEFGLDKRSVISFELFIKKAGVSPESCFYVADNPLVDFENSKKVGMNTVRILKGEYKKLPGNEYIDFEIKNLNSLLGILKI